MGHWVYGNKERIFINTALGCSAHCQYCYLPMLGMRNDSNTISAEDALSCLLEFKDFIPGPDGSILSIGCYSECWSAQNKPETFKLLKKLAGFKNYIQLATKKQITQAELSCINTISRFKNQIGIYLSVPTLSSSSKLELGTDPIDKRLSPLITAKDYQNLYFVLYIKPVLPEITGQDKERYKELMLHYQVPSVIGPLLSGADQSANRSCALVGEGNLYEVPSGEADALKAFLSRFGGTYTHSTDLITEFREREL